MLIGFAKPYVWLDSERELLRAIADRSALAKAEADLGRAKERRQALEQLVSLRQSTHQQARDYFKQARTAAGDSSTTVTPGDTQSAPQSVE